MDFSLSNYLIAWRFRSVAPGWFKSYTEPMIKKSWFPVRDLHLFLVDLVDEENAHILPLESHSL